MEGFRDLVLRQTIVRKTSGAYRIMDLKDRRNRDLLKASFSRYAKVVADRKNKLLRKYCVLWMNKTAIGYQPALWRWKFVIFRFDWSSLFPNHLTMMKRLAHLATQSEWRRKQYAFFKILVANYDSPYQHSRSSI